MRSLLFLFCLLAGSAPMMAALAAERYALVIGNDAYEALPALKKAVNDARAVGDTLEGMGFTVLRGENQTLRQMQDSLFDLSERLSPGDTVFLFYAGHGVALGGGNYLLPVDTPLPQGAQAEGRVRFAGLAEADLIAQVKEAGAQMTVVVLDACRDNPFPEAGTRAIGGTRGLQRPPEARGVFGIYSAGFGETALDRLGDADPDPNSVFTRALVPALADPNLSLVDIAYKVNEDVERLARTVGHEQNPAHYDQARGRDVFLAGRKPPAVAVPPVATAVPFGSGPCTDAKAHYDEAIRRSTRSALQAHLRFYGTCAYAPFAEEALAALAPVPEDEQRLPAAGGAFIFDSEVPDPGRADDPNSQSIFDSLQLKDQPADAAPGAGPTALYPPPSFAEPATADAVPSEPVAGRDGPVGLSFGDDRGRAFPDRGACRWCAQ